MKREIDIYDEIEEIEPKKLNPKAKKALIYSICAICGVIAAALIIVAVNLIFSGASSPEKAIAEYEKAAILYDIDGMIEYSSEYNKTVLYGNRKTSDRLLKAYLNKAYEEFQSKYSEDEIGFELLSAIEYSKDSAKYAEAMKKYEQKVKNASEDIEKIAIVKMTVIKGSSRTTAQYLAVKQDGRWYFGYAGA